MVLIVLLLYIYEPMSLITWFFFQLNLILLLVKVFLTVYKHSQCTYNQEFNSLWVHFDFNDSPLIKSVRSVLQLPHPVGTHKRSVQLPTVWPLHPRPGGDDRSHWEPTQEPGGQSEHWSWYDFCTSLFNSIKCPFYLIWLGYGDSPKVRILSFTQNLPWLHQTCMNLNFWVNYPFKAGIHYMTFA